MLQNLGFLLGCWLSISGSGDSSYLVSEYQQVSSTRIQGIIRQVDASGSRVIEYSEISPSSGGLILNRSDSARSSRFYLAESTPGQAVFFNFNNDVPSRIVFEKKEGTLVVRRYDRSGSEAHPVTMNPCGG